MKKTSKVTGYVKNDGTAVNAHTRSLVSETKNKDQNRLGPPAPPVDDIETHRKETGKNGEPNCVYTAEEQKTGKADRGWIVNKNGDFVFVGNQIFGGEQKAKGWVTVASGDKVWLGPKTKIVGVDLSETNLKNADLSEAEISNCNLSGCDISGALLLETKISQSDLSDAKLEASIAVHLFIEDSLLKRTDFTNADINQSVLLNNKWKNNNMLKVEFMNIQYINSAPYETTYERYNFFEAAKLLGLSENQFEFVVISSGLEVRENNTLSVVKEHFDPDLHHVPVWAIHDYQNILQSSK